MDARMYAATDTSSKSQPGARVGAVPDGAWDNGAAKRADDRDARIRRKPTPVSPRRATTVLRAPPRSGPRGKQPDRTSAAAGCPRVTAASEAARGPARAPYARS